MNDIFQIPIDTSTVDVELTRDPAGELGPILTEHAEKIGVTPAQLIRRMMVEPTSVMVPLKHGAQQVATFIPGHVMQGHYGPSPDVKVMVISKYPGKDEDRTRRLFVGGAGNLLRGALMTAEKRLDGDDVSPWDSSKWYITNICRFWPPDGSKSIRSVWEKECKFMLEEEIRICSPDWILLLGTEAVKFLFGKSANVTKFRGSVLDHRIRADTAKVAKVFVTENPAAACYMPDKVPGFRGDIARFCSMIRGKEPTVGETEYVIVDNVTDLNELVYKLLSEGATEFAVDCEWAGKNWKDPNGYLRTIQFSWAAGKAALVMLVGAAGNTFFPDTMAAVEPLNRLLCQRDENGRPKSKISGHFFRSDLPWLRDMGIDLLPFFTYDTILADHLIQENLEHKLEAVASRLTNMGRYDMELQKWIAENKELADVDERGYANIPDDILHPYALKDADATFRIREATMNEVMEFEYTGADGKKYSTFKDVVMRATDALYEMETTGLLADRERMLEIRQMFVDKLEELVEDFRKEIAWPDFNPRSFPQKVEFLYGEEYNYKWDEEEKRYVSVRPKGALSLRLRPVKTTDKPPLTWDVAESKMNENPDSKRFSPATDDEALGIYAVDHSLVAKLRDIGIVGQVLKNFLRVEEEGAKKKTRKDLLSSIWADGRVHTVLSQLAETGRMRSSKPNLQNLPKKREADYRRIFDDKKFPSVRSCFIAPPGNVLIESDYSKAEMYVLAWLAGDEELLAALAPGRDIHSERAVDAFNLDCAPTKEGLESIEAEHLRIAAKTINFGIPYQRSAMAIVREVKNEGGVIITADQAQAGIDSYFEKHRQVQAYLEECKNSVLDPGYMVNPFGRVRHFVRDVEEKQIWSQQREACNFPIQSTVADALYVALGNLYDYRQAVGMNYRLVLAIHDAVLLQVPCEEVDQVVDHVLPLCMSDGVPVVTKFGPRTLPIDISVGLRWDESATPQQLRELGIDEKYAKE